MSIGDESTKQTIDLSAHRELDDLYLVRDDPGLVALVEGGVEHLGSIDVKLVGEPRPAKVEA